MLLVMALLGVGTSAWATNYSGTVGFEAKSRSTYADGTFTTANNAGNGYALAVADLSGLENIASASSITLEFDVTISGRLIIGIGDKNTRGTTANGSSKSTYNTDGIIMRYAKVDDNYVRVNGGTNNSNVIDKSSHVTFTLDRTTGKYSYTITYVDGKSVVQTAFSGSNISTSVSNATIVEAYSWSNNQSNALSSVSYSYEYSAASFDYTVKAVDGLGAEIKTLASGTSATGEAVSVYVPYAFNKDDVWYTTSVGTYVAEATSINKDITVTYAENSSLVAFKEGESVVQDGDIDKANCSGGAYGHVAGGSRSTIATLPPGEYTFYGKLYERGDRGIYLRDGGNADNTTNEICNLGTNKNSAAGVYNANFTLMETTTVQFSGYTSGTSTNQSAGIDYVYIVRTGDANVSKTITSAGWATYCSPYALDLANATGLTDAYIVTGGANGVLAKTSVKGGTVPANTGLLLKGSEGTVTIPVAASSSTDVSGNKLVGVTTETAMDLDSDDDGTADINIYVLMNDATNGLGFYQTTATSFTLGANTAYLPANFTGSGARSFFSLFNAETTGIEDAVKSKEIKDKIFYNLSGQRVKKATKGLYIVNGKKYVK